MVDVTDRPKCQTFLPINQKKGEPKQAAMYRDKDLVKLWPAVGTTFAKLKDAMLPRDFCDCVLLLCKAGILKDKPFFKESIVFMETKPRDFKLTDIVTLIRISVTFEKPEKGNEATEEKRIFYAAIQ